MKPEATKGKTTQKVTHICFSEDDNEDTTVMAKLSRNSRLLLWGHCSFRIKFLLMMIVLFQWSYVWKNVVTIPETYYGSLFDDNDAAPTSKIATSSSVLTQGEEDSSSPEVVLTFGNSNNNKKKSTNNKKLLILGGLVEDGSKVRNSTLHFLLEMSCVHNVEIYIVGRKNMKRLESQFDDFLRDGKQQNCSSPSGSIYVYRQPIFVDRMDRRVQRISHAREFLRSLMTKRRQQEPVDVVGIVDFDLLQFPSPSQIIQHSNEMRLGKNDVDVLCAAGVLEWDGKFGYYDTYATVLLPDTFLKAPHTRVSQQLRPEEDASMIPGSNNFTSMDLLKWLDIQGGDGGKSESSMSNSLNPVPVRSCFGGLALYQSEPYFDARCSYTMLPQDPILNAKYAILDDEESDDSGEVCEHILFHECLRTQVDTNLSVAIQPDLRPLWKRFANLPYEKYEWYQLPVQIRNAAKTLGYTRRRWENDQDPKQMSREWSGLSSKQQSAAVTMGYNERTWNQ